MSSHNSSPSSIRSSIASSSAVAAEPSDRLLRSECRRQGGKHCGHVECQVRSSLSRRSGQRHQHHHGHDHDHDHSQVTTPLTMSPALSTMSSMTDPGGSRSLATRRSKLLEATASAVTTTKTTTTTTTHTTRRVVAAASGSSSNSRFIGIRSRLGFSNNNSNKSDADEGEEEGEEEIEDQSGKDGATTSSFRQIVTGGLSSLWSSRPGTSKPAQYDDDDRDVDESQLSDADDFAGMEKGALEAHLSIKEHSMNVHNSDVSTVAADDTGVAMETNRRLLVGRVFHSLVWLIGAICYFIKLACTQTVGMAIYGFSTCCATVSNLLTGAKHSIVIAISGILYFLKSKCSACYSSVSSVGLTGIKRVITTISMLVVHAATSLLGYADRARLSMGRAASAVIFVAIQMPASAVRTGLVVTRQRTNRSFTAVSTVFIKQKRRRRSCLSFVLLLLLLLVLLLLLLPVLLGYVKLPSDEAVQAAFSSSREALRSTTNKAFNFAYNAWNATASVASWLLLWLRDSAIAIAAMAAKSAPTWPSSPPPEPPASKISPTLKVTAPPTPGGCCRADFSALEQQVSALRSAVADLERQRLLAPSLPQSDPPKDVASAEALDVLASRLDQLELRFSTAESSTAKLTASAEQATAAANKLASSSADSTEALSASVSSKVADIAFRVEAVAERLNQRTDEAAASAAAAATAAAAANGSAAAWRLEVANLRADLVKLANQHRRHFASLADRLQLMSLPAVHSSASKDSVEDSSSSSTTIDELRQSMLEFRSRLSQLELSSRSTTSSSSSSLKFSSLAWCQSPADEWPDYALHSAGGYAVSIRCTRAYTVRRSYFHLFGVPVFSYSNGPNVALQPGVQLGECWPFVGFPGHLVVRLAAPARISHVTIDHVPRSLTYSGSAASAPKNMSVYGLHSESDALVDAELLGNFVYNAETGLSSQTFAISTNKKVVGFYSAVELVVHSNHGAEYTCLYRFRVHGSLV